MRLSSHEADVVSTRSMAVSSSGTQGSFTTKETLSPPPPPPTSGDTSHCMGVDAIKKLRQNYNINKVRMKGQLDIALVFICADLAL